MATNPQITEPVAPPTIDINTPATEIAAAMAAQQTAPEVPAVVPTVVVPPQNNEGFQLQQTAEGMELLLENGNVFKGKDVNEVLTKLAASKVQSERYIKELKNTQPAATPVAQPQAPARLSDADFDAQYWQIASDPTQGLTAAQRFMAQHRPEALLDGVAIALGLGSGQELKQQMGILSQTSATINNNVVAAQFHSANPDFPATEEASGKLIDYAVQNGLNPANPEHLGMAHAACLRKGIYAPAVVSAAAPTRATPPPTLRTNGSPAVTNVPSDKDLYSMPIEELRKQAFQRR